MDGNHKIVWTNCRVKLGDLKPWAQNPRMSTKAQAHRILQSLDDFGQVQTVAIGPDSEVYDGHQRLSALLTIHGQDYELDARRSSRALSDVEHRALVIALHAGAYGGWDWGALSGWDTAQLGSWGMDGDLLKQWNDDACNLREMLGAESEVVSPDDFNEYGEDIDTEYQCPKCGYRWSGKVNLEPE